MQARDGVDWGMAGVMRDMPVESIEQLQVV